MKKVKINSLWDAQIDDEGIVTLISKLSRVTLFCNVDEKFDVVEVMASRFGSKIGFVKDRRDVKGLAPYVTVQVLE